MLKTKRRLAGREFKGLWCNGGWPGKALLRKWHQKTREGGGLLGWILGREKSQAEGITGSKALKQQPDWWARGMARRWMWLEHSEPKGASEGREDETEREQATGDHSVQATLQLWLRL